MKAWRAREGRSARPVRPCYSSHMNETITHRGVALPPGIDPERADTLADLIVDVMDDAMLSDQPQMSTFESAMLIVREVMKLCPSPASSEAASP